MDAYHITRLARHQHILQRSNDTCLSSLLVYQRSDRLKIRLLQYTIYIRYIFVAINLFPIAIHILP